MNAVIDGFSLEYDEGSLSMRWVSDDKKSSLSVVKTGDGRIVGIVSTVDPPRSEVVFRQRPK